MDPLVCYPTFSPRGYGGPPSPVSLFSAAAGTSAGDDNHHQQQYPVLEFQSSEVPEQWLAAADEEEMPVDRRDDGDDHGGATLPLPERSRRRGRPRGRKLGPRTADPAMSHVEAERQRRDRLNRRFCDLRAVVPRVSRMDRASLLADAVAYIGELRARVETLEAEARTAAEASRLSRCSSLSRGGGDLVGESGVELEVRTIGREAAALRLTTTAARHAPALRALDLAVQHASVCRVGGVTVQDVVVDVPAAGLQGEDHLRAALLRKVLQESG